MLLTPLFTFVFLFFFGMGKWAYRAQSIELPLDLHRQYIIYRRLLLVIVKFRKNQVLVDSLLFIYLFFIMALLS